MNLTDYCDILNKSICVTYYPNQNKRWVASFDGGEIKENRMLCSCYGNGINPESAIKNYLKQINGKTIVFNAMTDNRLEFTIPSNLDY